MFLFCFGVWGTQSQGCVCSRLCVCQALPQGCMFAKHSFYPPGLPLVIKWIKSKLCFTEKSLIIYLLINFEHLFWRVPKICVTDICDLFLSFFPPSTPSLFLCSPSQRFYVWSPVPWVSLYMVILDSPPLSSRQISTIFLVVSSVVHTQWLVPGICE